MHARLTAAIVSLVALAGLGAGSASAAPIDQLSPNRPEVLKPAPVKAADPVVHEEAQPEEAQPEEADGALDAPVTPGAVFEASKMEGGSTGDGPADDEDCQRYADGIQDTLDAAVFLGEWGMDSDKPALLDRADRLMERADEKMQEGMEEGCFFMD